MNVFLSYAVGQWDAPIAARLRAIAAAYDVAILLPDRTQMLNNGLQADTQAKISQSDAVIALVTTTAHPNLFPLVNLELQAAAQARKPILALMEQGAPFQAAPGTRLVYFNRLDPTAHEKPLMDALEQIRLEKQQWKQNLTTLGWIAGITLGMIALSELVADKK